MFDANMRHLPNGFEFYCDICACKKGTVLYEAGLRKGDVVRAKMLDDDSDNPQVMFFFNGKEVCAYSDSEGWSAYYIIYLGKTDFTDFNYENDLIRAKEAFVKEYLLESAKTREVSTCVSGETVEGAYCQYSEEYLKWSMKAQWVKITVHMTDDERDQWFIDNPAPKNKFE